MNVGEGIQRIQYVAGQRMHNSVVTNCPLQNIEEFIKPEEHKNYGKRSFQGAEAL